MPAKNIAIALGATIENADGSAQADILTGNKVGNSTADYRIFDVAAVAISAGEFAGAVGIVRR